MRLAAGARSAAGLPESAVSAILGRADGIVLLWQAEAERAVLAAELSLSFAQPESTTAAAPPPSIPPP